MCVCASVWKKPGRRRRPNKYYSCGWNTAIIIIIIIYPASHNGTRDAHVEKSLIVRLDVNKYKLRDATVRRRWSSSTAPAHQSAAVVVIVVCYVIFENTRFSHSERTAQYTIYIYIGIYEYSYGGVCV